MIDVIDDPYFDVTIGSIFITVFVLLYIDFTRSITTRSLASRPYQTYFTMFLFSSLIYVTFLELVIIWFIEIQSAESITFFLWHLSLTVIQTLCNIKIHGKIASVKENVKK